MAKLMPYGETGNVHNVSKVGKKLTSRSLAARMPSAEIAAKVGVPAFTTARAARVVRLNDRG